MPSLTTIYRVIVMLAVGAIVVKGWRTYGPSAEQVKSTVVSAIDMAQTAMQHHQSPDEETQMASDARGTAPRFSKQPPAAEAGAILPPAATLTRADTPGPPIDSISKARIPPRPDSSTPPAETPSAVPAGDGTRMPALLSRLAQLGAAETKLVPWGSSGHLYRFCCRAAMTDSPAYARHFESVAPEPVMAVEQVVAKVEAWRTEQHRDTMLR